MSSHAKYGTVPWPLKIYRIWRESKKNALKIILQDEYQDYNNALSVSGLKSLFDRRSELCLRFAKSCVKNELTKTMFPLNEASKVCEIQTRHREKYKVTQCRTKRLQNSAIPYMQNLLNSEKSKQ